MDNKKKLLKLNRDLKIKQLKFEYLQDIAILENKIKLSSKLMSEILKIRDIQKLVKYQLNSVFGRKGSKIL